MRDFDTDDSEPEETAKINEKRSDSMSTSTVTPAPDLALLHTLNLLLQHGANPDKLHLSFLERRSSPARLVAELAEYPNPESEQPSESEPSCLSSVFLPEKNPHTATDDPREEHYVHKVVNIRRLESPLGLFLRPM